MSSFKTLDMIGDVTGKRILVRVDLNVPMADGKVTDLTRIERVAPTMTELADKGAKVILLAHFGRPKDILWTLRDMLVLRVRTLLFGWPR